MTACPPVKPRLLLKVAVDTPLGVVFLDCEASGKGRVLVVERIRDAVAEHQGWRPDEVEVVTVTDRESGRLLWSARAA